MPNTSLICILRTRNPDFYIGIGSKEWFLIKKIENDPLLEFSPDKDYFFPTKFIGFEQFRDAPVGTEFIVKHSHNRKRKVSIEYSEQNIKEFMNTLTGLWDHDIEVQYAQGNEEQALKNFKDDNNV